jgi:Domain of unknown function (DUF1772)
VALRALQFVSTFLLVLVVGPLWGLWFGLSRSITDLTPQAFLEVGHATISNFAPVMPFLMPAAMLATLLTGVLLLRVTRVAASLTLAGFVLFVGVALVTVLGNVPLNNQIRDWTAATMPADWWRVRDTWQQLHTVRTFLSLAGLAYVLAACLASQSPAASTNVVADNRGEPALALLSAANAALYFAAAVLHLGVTVPLGFATVGFAEPIPPATVVEAAIGAGLAAAAVIAWTNGRAALAWARGAYVFAVVGTLFGLTIVLLRRLEGLDVWVHFLMLIGLAAKGLKCTKRELCDADQACQGSMRFRPYVIRRRHTPSPQRTPVGGRTEPLCDQHATWIQGRARHDHH